MCGGFDHASGITGRTNATSLTRKGNEEIMTTFGTTGTCESMGQDSTFEVTTECLLGETGHGVVLPGILSTKGEKSLEVGLYYSIKGSFRESSWVVG
jgi:hypothetical protein